MSCELAIRVSSEIGAWVRQQPGSATKTVLALARDLGKRRERISAADPGPGDDRLKVRLEPVVIRSIRGATHSRDATAAVRKLLFWGASRPDLSPAAPRLLASSPLSKPDVGGSPSSAPVRRALPSAGQVSRECWNGVRLSPGIVPASPSRELLKVWRRLRAESLKGFCKSC